MDSLRNLGFHSLNEVLALENFPTVLPTELKNIHVIELFSLMKENNKDVKWITSIFKTTTKQEDVNEDALITKIYRLISNEKKGGQQRADLRNSRFSLPTSTISSTNFSPTPVPTLTVSSSTCSNISITVEKKLKLTEIQLVDRRQRVGVLSEENKKLKRKLEDLSLIKKK